MKRKVLFYIGSIFIIAMMTGLLMLITTGSFYREGVQVYDALLQHMTAAPQETVPPTAEIRREDPTEGPVEDPVAESEEEAEEWREVFTLPDHIVLPEVNFEALYEINADVAAWLILPDTPINHPVVRGHDNVRYLHHLFDGTRSNVGTLFIDTYNAPEFADRNTIIYGHNLLDGSMFAVLENYSSQSFFDAHPWVFLLTPAGNYVIQLFAGYAADVEASSWRLWFDDDSAFEDWIDERRGRSDFVSDVTVGPSDQVVTLSTCSVAFYDARYAVVGRLVPIG